MSKNDKLNAIIEAVVEQTGRSREEVVKLIDDKWSEFHECIHKWGVASSIARGLGVDI